MHICRPATSPLHDRAGLLAGLAVCGAAAAAQPTPTPQPTGALTGKIVYLHPGHGWTANNLGNGSWSTQRPETNEIVEDLLNQDFHTIQAEELWRAGATIVPLRPIGHQPIEVVLDNDDPGVEFTGAWFNSSSNVFFGSPGDVPYRFALTSATATASVHYRPTIPEAGPYPVYAWTLAGIDRVEQRYLIHHSSGTSSVTIDHRRVGGGWVYLGTYHFGGGTGGSVEITNENASPGDVVIADAIRFGNGMGDIDRGAGPSGDTREDEAALYWIERQSGVGIPSSAWRSSSSDSTATVGAPVRWAEWMNRSAAGTLADRVYLSHHSNAANGTARGVIALLNGNNNPATRTPNQLLLAQTLGEEINDDMVSLNGTFEHDWVDRSVVILDRTDFEFGEINNTLINSEFDATIVERGFHDNPQDAELMRDPKVAEQLARSTTQGLIRFFNAIDGGATPIVAPPPPVTDASAIPVADGQILVSWTAPVPGPAAGDAPTQYRIRTSTDGRNFLDGPLVPAIGPTTALLDNLDPASGPVFITIAAVNAGGESPATAVLAATPFTGPSAVLIVDGFDRRDRFQNIREPYFSGTIDRTRERLQNARSYAVEHAEAIAAASADIAFGTADNDAVASGSIALSLFDAIAWFAGGESPATQTLDVFEVSQLSGFVDGGGHLLISGTDLAYDLGGLGNGPAFLNNILDIAYVARDAGTYAASGVPETRFASIDLAFDNGTRVYDVAQPDVIAPIDGAAGVLTYATGGTAGVLRPVTPQAGAVLTLGFPFETILAEDDRRNLMAAALEALGLVTTCVADVTTTGTANGIPDGEVDLSDFSFYLTLWSIGDTRADTTTSGTASGVPDGQVDLSDFSFYLTLWSAACP